MSRRPPRTPPAVRGFDRAAATYERARPEYPPAAVRHLRRVLPVGPGRTVVDLGSGTGKFTRAIEPWGSARIAVEPTPGMRAVFARTVPDVPVLDGTAEAIPLPDRFADAVVSAQAFHWFRPKPALREIRRILRPQGGLALLWNTRDDLVPWSRRLTELLAPYRRSVPHERDRRWRSAFASRQSGFSRLRRRVFRHSQWGRPALFVERALSVSSIALLSPARRRAFAEAVRELLATDPDTAGRSWIELPYLTEVYWCRRR